MAGGVRSALRAECDDRMIEVDNLLAERIRRRGANGLEDGAADDGRIVAFDGEAQFRAIRAAFQVDAGVAQGGPDVVDIGRVLGVGVGAQVDAPLASS